MRIILILILFFPLLTFANSKWNRQIDSLLKIDKPFWNVNFYKLMEQIPDDEQDKFITEIIERAEKEKNYQLAGRIYLSLPHFKGLYIYNQDQYNSFIKAGQYFKQVNFQEGMVEANIMLGLNFKSLDDIDRMRYYFREANRIAQTSNKEYVKLTGYWTMFELMNYIDKLDSSKYYMNLCDSLYPLCKFPSDREKVHADMLIPRFKSAYYAKLKQFDSASYYFKISFGKNENKGILNASSTLVLPPRDAQINLEFLLDYIDESDIENFKKGIVLNNAGEDILYQKVFRIFGEYYVAKKNYDSATVYFQKALAYYDSAYYKDPRVALSKMEQEKSEIEFRAKEELAAQQRNYIIIGAVVILIVILIITWFIYSRYKDKARVNEKLNELNSTKDKLFAIISHDLRSPLASLKQMLELLNFRFDKLSDEAKQKYINNLSISSNKMYLLLDNLLNWSKMNLGKMYYNESKINIKEIIDGEYELLKDSFVNKSLKFDFEQNHSQEIYGDKNLISIAVRNMMSNAIKYSPKGSTIECEIYMNNDFIGISIKDYGEGIPKEIIENILNQGTIRATIGTGNEKGNGLGLMICQEVIKLHNGRFLIESELAQFTIVKIEIPYKNNFNS